MVFYQDAGLQKTVRAEIDFFLVDVAPAPAPRKRPLDLDIRLAELTAFFSVFSFHMPLMEMKRAASIDAALAATTKDFCLIQSFGQLFYGYDQLSYAMTEAMAQCDLVTGHIEPQEPGFAPHCLMINRRAWEKLGRPPFGQPDPAQGRGHGWSMIATGAKAGLTPKAWEPAVARSLWTCEMSGGDPFEWLEAMDDVTRAASEDAKLQATIDFFRNIPDRRDAAKKVFVFNSEADGDLPPLRHRPGLDCAFVLASGFKANRILERLGFHEKTNVVVYDYSAPALALRRMMVEDWNGEDFGSFFASVRPRLDTLFPNVAYLPAPVTKDPAAINREFEREIASVFANPEEWRAHWQHFRKLSHHYIEADVIGDRDAAKAMLATHARGHAVMWISDMFNSPNAVGKYSWNRRQSAFDVIADTLAVKTESDLILGGTPALWLRP